MAALPDLKTGDASLGERYRRVRALSQALAVLVVVVLLFAAGRT